MPAKLDEQALRSLAQYRPFDGGSEGIEMVHDDLVVAACQSAGGEFASLEACREFIQSNWKIELEINEIRESRERLEGRGVAEKLGGGLAISDQKKKELEKVRAVWEGWETQAVEEWETSIREDFPLLGDADLEKLRAQLRPWLDHVICRHGAEASLLLYPGDDRAAKLIDSLGNTDLSFLPDLGRDLNGIRTNAFRMFIREPTETQLAFLGRLLNTGFYQTVLSLDPKARHLAAAEAKQTVLYLDTNFLYAVLGVGSQVEAHTASRLLDLCRQMGYSLRITPWTIDELRTSIASSRSDVLKVHRSQKSAKVMAEVSGEKGFAPAYWRALRDHGTDPADFFGKFDHFQRFLKDNGIKESPEKCAEIDADVEGIRAYSSPLEAMYGVGTKNRAVIEHDAKTRLLIERLRGDAEPTAYMNVRYWFLTESTSLPTYGRSPIRASKRPKYPFCILTSTWAQIVRSVMPRTADLDEVIVGLLASPYVGYKLPISGTPKKAVERVVARIDSLKDVPASVAVAMVGDQSMAAKIGGEVDEAEMNRIIEESLTQKAEELEVRIATSAKETVAAQRARIEAEDRAKQAVESKSESEAERDQARQEALAARASEEAAQRQADEKAAREAVLQQEVNESREREENERSGREGAERRAQRMRDGIAIVSALIFVAIGGGILVAQVIDSRLLAIVVACLTMLGVYGSLSFISASLGKQLINGVTLVVAVVTIVSALWPHSESSSSPTSKQPAPAPRTP
jgi:hypothetical protein